MSALVELKCPNCKHEADFSKLETVPVGVPGEAHRNETQFFCPQCNNHIATIKHDKLYLISAVDRQFEERYVGHVTYKNGYYELTRKGGTTH